MSSRPLICAAMTVCLAATVVGTGQGPRLSAGAALPAEIPFEIEAGALTVEAGLGAGLPFRAVVDTAIGDCLVSNRLATERGLGGTDEVIIASPLGHIRGTLGGRHSIRLGRVVIDGIPLCIADPIAQLSAAPPANGVPVPDAWVGNSALSLVSIEVDPARKRLTLADAGATPALRGGAAVPIDIASGRVEVRARANNAADFSAVVATGVRGCLVPRSLVQVLKLAAGQERSVALPGGGSVRVAAARLKELRLGSAKVNDVPVLAALDDIPGLNASTGLIGTDALMRFRMQINYARRQVVFVAARSPATGDSPAIRRSRPERQTQESRPSLSAHRSRPRDV